MLTYKAVPLHFHAGLETLLGPAIMVAPFVFGFGQAAGAVCVLIGVLMLGLAFQIPGPQRAVSLSAHAGFDHALGVFAATAGIAIGFTTGAWTSAAFLVGTGVAIVALAASTRFSVRDA